MLQLLKNTDLKPYNTFGISVSADLLIKFSKAADLMKFLENNSLPEKYIILGGGSNILFTDDFKGWLLHPDIPGIQVVKEDREHIWLEAGAGVYWDDVVAYSVDSGWGGIENLSGIPGKVGATPVQNIGAYGIEVGNRIDSVTGIDLSKKEVVHFAPEECRFGYRDSVFKNELKNRIIVTSVVYKLDKHPEYHLEYGSLKDEVERLGNISLSTIRKTVIYTRDSKLPDYHKTGNAGSFFKNPVVEWQKAEELMVTFDKIPVYETTEENQVKLAAGWLIEQCGWKGYREGDAGVHPVQALVLVNYGKANGREIVALSEKIKKSVAERFGVKLEPEVNVL